MVSKPPSPSMSSSRLMSTGPSLSRRTIPLRLRMKRTQTRKTRRRKRKVERTMRRGRRTKRASGCWGGESGGRERDIAVGEQQSNNGAISSIHHIRHRISPSPAGRRHALAHSPSAMDTGSVHHQPAVGMPLPGDSTSPPPAMDTRSPTASPRHRLSTRRRAGSQAYNPAHELHEHGVAAIRNFLRCHTCYDAFPVSFRLIVLDTKLTVKKALQCFLLNGLSFFLPSLAYTRNSSSRRRLCPPLELTDLLFRRNAHRPRHHPSHPVLLPHHRL